MPALRQINDFRMLARFAGFFGRRNALSAPRPKPDGEYNVGD
jgi:hypothetical protein